jgi:hypothetical protein
VKAPENVTKYLGYGLQLNALRKCADPDLLTVEADTYFIADLQRSFWS